MAKELILIHPRKVYYYLTTFPRQPIPDPSDELILGVDGKHITPSVSSLDQDDEDLIARQRSPSPEVDLSSPDFEEGQDVDLNNPAGSGNFFRPVPRLLWPYSPNALAPCGFSAPGG